eukprot:scaffold3910_cov537-Prasinococcus_capsulatus_cf.AAC.7
MKRVTSMPLLPQSAPPAAARDADGEPKQEPPSPAMQSFSKGAAASFASLARMPGSLDFRLPHAAELLALG